MVTCRLVLTMLKAWLHLPVTMVTNYLAHPDVPVSLLEAGLRRCLFVSVCLSFIYSIELVTTVHACVILQVCARTLISSEMV